MDECPACGEPLDLVADDHRYAVHRWGEEKPVRELESSALACAACGRIVLRV